VLILQQASNALSALQDKLVQVGSYDSTCAVNAVLFCLHAMSRLPLRNKVHVELEKLRCKNREENAKIRADARLAYEQRIHDVANDSLADSSSLASFIESSVAGMALK
jgi:hypothetical protein